LKVVEQKRNELAAFEAAFFITLVECVKNDVDGRGGDLIATDTSESVGKKCRSLRL
jgi:hypothetical protein